MRREEGIYGIFHKSKKTLRSRIKEGGKQEGLKGMMREMMEEMRRMWERWEER